MRPRANGQYNSGGYCNAEADKLMNMSNSENRQRQARRDACSSWKRSFMKRPPSFPLHWQNLAWGAREGVQADKIVNALNFPYFGDLVVDK